MMQFCKSKKCSVKLLQILIYPEKMKIDIKTIEKIGKLTRIAFSESEKRELVNDLKNIDKLISKICEIDTDNVEPLFFLNEDFVTLRADKPDTNQTVDSIIKNAPEMKNGYYIVPRIIKK